MVGLLLAFLVLRVEDIFVSAAMVSGFFMVLLAAPRLWELMGIAAMGATALLVRAALVPHQRLSHQLLSAALGIGAMALMVGRLLSAEADAIRRRHNRMMLTSVALLTLCVLITPAVIFHSAAWTPRTLDLYAFSFDASLGFHPSFALGRVFHRHAGFGEGCRLIYLYLPAVVGLTQFAASASEWKENGRYFVLKAFVVMAVLGWTLYQVFPAAGPIYLMPGDFPHSPLSTSMASHLAVEPVQLDARILRNAMPSLHMAWALLVFYSLYPLGKVCRWLGGVFLVATVLATLGMGEHYLVDLVVSFPFTLACIALLTRGVAWRNRWRMRAIACGGLLTAMWLVALRYETRLLWLSPALPWTAVAMTTGVSVYLGWRLMMLTYPTGEQAELSHQDEVALIGGLQDSSTA